MFSNMYSLISKENDENCVVDNMYTVFWFNKQNEFEIGRKGCGVSDPSDKTKLKKK